MRTEKFALVCALLVLSVLEPITARKGFSSGGGRSRGGGHSYPHSGGLSGSGGHHGYPSSGGLSGSGGGSHGYPASGGLSGGGSHGYPSHGGASGGSHAYPSSGGSHGYPSSGGSHGYPSSGGSHGYPSSGGLSGSGSSNSHGYPAGKGLSGNTGSHSTTNVHHHYHYAPPKEIRYTPVHGGAPVSYPVYHGSPPTYVYKYKDSGSKYGTLLAGLALLNLGTIAAAAGTAAYVASNHNHGSSHYTNYQPQRGEICKFGVKKDNGDYEETRIDCQLISSFIMQADQQPQSGGGNKTIVTTSVTNVTMVNTTNGVPEHPPMNTTRVGDKLYQIMADGTLVPVNETALNMTANANGVSSSVVTNVTTVTVTDALDVKGQPIAVTPGMQCFVIRHTPVNDMRKTVPCGLLQTYAEKSLKRNSAARHAPAFTILAVALAAFIMH